MASIESWMGKILLEDCHFLFQASYSYKGQLLGSNEFVRSRVSWAEWNCELAPLLCTVHHCWCQRSSSGVGGSGILGQFLSSNKVTSSRERNYEVADWPHCFPTLHLWRLVLVLVGWEENLRHFIPRCQIWWGHWYSMRLQILITRLALSYNSATSWPPENHQTFRPRCLASKGRIDILLQRTCSIFLCCLGWWLVVVV